METKFLELFSKKTSEEPHGVLPSSSLEPAALYKPIFKAFPELAASEFLVNPQSKRVQRSDPKPFWNVHSPEAHLAH